MYELPISEYSKIITLFDSFSHGRAIIFSVIERTRSGRIFVDSIQHPTQVLLCPKIGYMYISANEKDNAFLHDAEETIFNNIVPAMDEKEVVLFSADQELHKKLSGFY